MNSRQCRRCNMVFETRRDLVNHQLRTKHSDINLICPWCQNKIREFRWTQDLRRHARQQHKVEHDAMSPKLLSTGNCFYFCRSPTEYEYLFDINKSSTPEAQQAKELVARWCNHHSEDFKKWQEGWCLVTSPTEQPPQPQPQPPHTQHSHYTETAPTTKRTLEDTYTLQHIILTPNNITCYLQNEEAFFLVRLSSDTFNDTKSISSLTRKMLTLNPNFTAPTDTWKFTNCSSQREDISALLGVQSQFINTIFTQPSQLFKLVKTTQLSSPKPLIATEAEEPQAHIPSPAHLTPYTTPTQNATPHVGQTPKSEEDGESLRSPSPISLAGDESPSYDPKSPRYTATPLPTASSINTQPQTPTYNPYSPQHTSKTPHNTESTAQPNTPQRYSPAPTHSNQPTYIPTPKQSTLQKQAHDLLAVGSHPLLPAARRDWSAVSDESILITPSLKWPPKNWKALTADQRTLASEYATMTLHNIQQTSLQITDRTQLLHKYNYIVLPGCKGTHQTQLTRAQYHNYQLVRSIATGSSTLPREEQQEIVNLFSKNSPSELLQTLSHIPLRLTK